jgi:hypothetical protein
MVNKSAEADLRAAKMLFDIMKEVGAEDRRGGAGQIDADGPGLAGRHVRKERYEPSRLPLQRRESCCGYRRCSPFSGGGDNPAGRGRRGLLFDAAAARRERKHPIKIPQAVSIKARLSSPSYRL